MSLGALLKMLLGSYICSSPNSVVYTGCTGYGVLVGQLWAGGVLVKPGQKTGLFLITNLRAAEKLNKLDENQTVPAKTSYASHWLYMNVVNINALPSSGALEKLISAPFMLLDSLKAGSSSSMHQAPMWGILHRTPPAVTFQLGDKDFVNCFE
ncbi:hypothetical protein F4604DRAFT_1687140 [Suillus subluteus]|nr:hypothetical protein F4604DRAFT_1687140 [Suillus subluteus]